MDERQQVEIEESSTVARKAEWIRPEVDRLLTGGAEGSSDISTDGIDIPS